MLSQKNIIILVIEYTTHNLKLCSKLSDKMVVGLVTVLQDILVRWSQVVIPGNKKEKLKSCSWAKLELMLYSMLQTQHT